MTTKLVMLSRCFKFLAADRRYRVIFGAHMTYGGPEPVRHFFTRYTINTKNENKGLLCSSRTREDATYKVFS